MSIFNRSTRLRAGLMAACILAFTHAFPAIAGAQEVTFDQALAMAEQRSPMLIAREAAVQSAEAARTAAGRPPDPTLSVGIENLPVSGADRFSVDRDPMTMRRIGVMQDVPNEGKRAADRENATARFAREETLLVAERLAVRREAALAWLGHHYAQRQLVVIGDLERENRFLQDTLAARVGSGKALPAESVMAKQEALQLADRRDELQVMLSQAGARLRSRIGGVGPVKTTTAAPLISVEPDKLLGRLDRHVELVAFGPMLRMALADEKQAQASRRGDWGWEVAYGRRARSYGDMVSFQLTFELPVSPGTKQDPLIAARRRDVDRLQAEREDVSRRIVADVESQTAELRRLERALERQQADGLSLAQQRVQLTLASYESGRADLGAVLTARRESAEARLRALDLEQQLMSQRARLAYLIAD